MPVRKTTIIQLRRELRTKELRLEKLEGRRKKIAAGLAAIDREIAMLSGPARQPRRKKVGKKKAAAKAKKAGRPKAAQKKKTRGKRGASLVEYVREVLAGVSEGMRVREVTAAVKKAGYKSKSKDFYGIVATTLRDKRNFKRLNRGTYKLAD